MKEVATISDVPIFESRLVPRQFDFCLLDEGAACDVEIIEQRYLLRAIPVVYGGELPNSLSDFLDLVYQTAIKTGKSELRALVRPGQGDSFCKKILTGAYLSAKADEVSEHDG